MSDERRMQRGTQSEDVVFEKVGPGPVVTSSSAGPVSYVTIANDDQLLGFLWHVDEPPAASFAIRKAAGGVADNVGDAWAEVPRHDDAPGVIISLITEEHFGGNCVRF